MGTRSLTIIQDGKTEVCVIYRQYDGHCDGHGAELLEYLKGKRVTNGITNDRASAPFNGAGDLAMRLVVELKRRGARHEKGIDYAGNYYLLPAGTRDQGEEYTYTIHCSDYDALAKGKDRLRLTVEAYDKAVYKGLLDNFKPKAAQAKLDDEDE